MQLGVEHGVPWAVAVHLLPGSTFLRGSLCLVPAPPRSLSTSPSAEVPVPGGEEGAASVAPGPQAQPPASVCSSPTTPCPHHTPHSVPVGAVWVTHSSLGWEQAVPVVGVVGQ